MKFLHVICNPSPWTRPGIFSLNTSHEVLLHGSKRKILFLKRLQKIIPKEVATEISSYNLQKKIDENLSLDSRIY
jgi:hypothetical protein